MQRNLQWKLLFIVAVAGLAVWGVYPPADNIRLGLDLQGGAHLVLRVQTDDALQVETETSAEQLAEQLSLQGMDTVTAVATDPTTVRVEGVPPERDAEFRTISDERLALSYDREPGAGGSYTFRMRPPIASAST